jgi:hypothetical protein
MGCFAATSGFRRRQPEPQTLTSTAILLVETTEKRTLQDFGGICSVPSPSQRDCWPIVQRR